MPPVRKLARAASTPHAVSAPDASGSVVEIVARESIDLVVLTPLAEHAPGALCRSSGVSVPAMPKGAGALLEIELDVEDDRRPRGAPA